MAETIRTQRKKIKTYPAPPKSMKSIADVRAYLVLLYNALTEDRPVGFAGEVFVSRDAPPEWLGKDGDIYIYTKE